MPRDEDPAAHPRLHGRLLNGLIAVVLGSIVLGADSIGAASYTQARSPAGVHQRSRVDVAVTAINEAQGTITLTVSGFRSCGGPCVSTSIR